MVGLIGERDMGGRAVGLGRGAHAANCDMRWYRERDLSCRQVDLQDSTSE